MTTIPRVLKFLSTLILSFLLFFLVVPSVQAANSLWLSKGNTTEKVIALTIDDGSDGTNFNRILNVLDDHNVHATFFLTGSGAEKHPQVIKDAVSEGHDIGNHSYNHPDFTEISTTSMLSQLSRTETIIKNLTGESTKPYFRAPFGSTNAQVLQTVGNAGYTHTFHWTIDTLDWTGNTATTIYNRVMNNLQPGAIVLMHTGAGATGTVEALKKLIPAIKNKGYRFVTLSQLMNPSIQPTLPTTGTSYVVRSGDTLYRIANQYNTTVRRIADLNGITNVNLIRVGQVLRLPGTSSGGVNNSVTPLKTHTVRTGETLYALALRYKTTILAIAQENNIKNVNLIRVGQVLKIPGTSGSGTVSPPSSSIRTYTVRPGDTLYAIANRYGTTILKIAQKNNISNVNLIRVGQVLHIP